MEPVDRHTVVCDPGTGRKYDPATGREYLSGPKTISMPEVIEQFGQRPEPREYDPAVVRAALYPRDVPGPELPS